MDLQGRVDAKFDRAIAAPPLRLAPVIPAKAGIRKSANSPADPKPSAERNNVIPVKTGTAALPSPLMG